MQLTSEETDAVEKGQVVPVEINEVECVILRRDLFDRVRHLIYDDSELSQQEMRNLLARLGQQTGWNDPVMDAYDNYDEERKCIV